MFGTSLLEEYRRARDALGLDRAALLHLARTGFIASLLPAQVKARHLAELSRSGRSPAAPPR